MRPLRVGIRIHSPLSAYLRSMTTADLFVKINTLPTELQKEVGEFVDKLLQKLQKPHKKERPLGMFKGKIHVADDFDAPLEDFKDLA